MGLVVPVALAYGVEAFVVFVVEELVGQVVGVFLTVARHLNLRLDGIELGVAGNHACGLVFLAHDVFLEPSASLVAFFRAGHAFNVNGKCADGSIFLHGLRADGRAVEADGGQCEVGLLYHVEDIVHAGGSGSHGDSHLAGSSG